MEAIMSVSVRIGVFCVLSAFALCGISAAQTVPVKVDFSKSAGAIKPLHGINNSPVRLNEEMREMREAGIPYSRLHDSVGRYGGAHFVDISNVFPNFDADPSDPASYDFAFTDAYLRSLNRSGVKIFYRLGNTIEGYYHIKEYNTQPPADYEKWAKICEGIIRHYNEGWANGFKYGIEYWEIWNEPDNRSMWSGTSREYYELYRVAANYLKKRFPNIKIGGFASCGFYYKTRPNPKESYKYYMEFAEGFFDYISSDETRAPLDFFSWHLYTDSPEEIVAHSECARKLMDGHGFKGAESIFNEWNLPTSLTASESRNRKNEIGASFVAAAFCAMQNSTIDKAMYYDALPTRSYCGLYTFPEQNFTKTYFSFKAFNELNKLGTAVACESPKDSGVYVCAAKSEDGSRGAVMIANYSGNRKLVKLECAGKAESCFITDADYTYTELNYRFRNSNIALAGNSVALIKFDLNKK